MTQKTESIPLSREESQRRIRSAFTRFARMSEWDHHNSRFITLALNGRMEKFWEGALEAAKITPKETGTSAVYPAIDQSFMAGLRENPNLQLIAELYNRIPRETVALQETALEVARQTVKTMEERNRVDLHPDGYLDVLNNFVARLLQKGEIEEGLARAQDAVAFAEKRYAQDTERFAPQLAQALDHQTSAYLFLQRHAEALETMDKALAVYRELAVATPKEYSRSLAICLNTRVSALTALGRLEEAAESAAEAVQRFRDITNSTNGTQELKFGEGLEPWIADVRPDLAACLFGAIDSAVPTRSQTRISHSGSRSH